MKRSKIMVYICCQMAVLLCLQFFQLPVLGAGNIQNKLEKSIVLYIGNSNAIAKNNLTKVDTQNKLVAPLIKDGRTLVPVRFIAENFGAAIGWDGATSTVTITQGEKVIKLVLGSNIMLANGEEKTLDVPAESIGGRTFIPLRALTNALGKQLFWDDRGLIVISDEEEIFNRTSEKELINDVICLVTGDAVKLVNKNERISMSIDPRIELISVIQILSGFGEKFKDSMTELDFKYKKKVNEYFSPYKDHEAVKQLSAMMKDRTFNHFLPASMMLNISNPPELKPKGRYPESLLSMSGDYATLDSFSKALNDFAEKSNFSKFYYDNFTLYKEIVSDTFKVGNGLTHIENLESYIGKNHNSYSFILGPLVENGFLNWRPNGKSSDYTQLFGAKKVFSDKPVFGEEYDFKMSIWYNVSKPFISPLLKQYTKDMEKYSNLYKPVEEKMKGFSYNTWISSAEANITRAIFARLAYQEYNTVDLLAAYEKDGFLYVKPLASKLEEYERSRDKYPTIDSFFPKLLEVFESLSSKQ